MKLLTHNMLTSNVKGVKNGFPLIIEASIAFSYFSLKVELDFET